MRARMSLRTGRPKTESARSISPTCMLSRLVTADFMALFLLLRRAFRSRRLARDRGGLESRRERDILGRRPLLGVAHQDITAVRSGHGTLDHDQAALGIDRDDLQVLGGDPHVAQMSRHLLARKSPARILAVAGRAVGAMGDRDAVGRAQAAEIVPLHDAGEALADAGS